MTDIINDLLTEAALPTQEREEPVIKAVPQNTTSTTAEKKEVVEENLIDAELVQASTEIIIDFVDSVQENILKFVTKRKKQNLIADIAGEDAPVKLQKAILKVKKKELDNSNVEFTAQEIELLNIEQTVKDILEELPFTDKEKLKLERPLKVLVSKNGGFIPPEIALLMGITTIVGSRIAEVVTL
jgi:hypothetical protein